MALSKPNFVLALLAVSIICNAVLIFYYGPHAGVSNSMHPAKIVHKAEEKKKQSKASPPQPAVPPPPPAAAAVEDLSFIGRGLVKSGQSSGTFNHTMCHRTLNSRGDLPWYLTMLGLTGEAVEIGVRRGHYSQHILKNWPGHLHLVDPWERQEEMSDGTGTKKYNDISNAPQQEHDDNLDHVKKMLGGLAPGRFTVHRDYSVEAAKAFKDGQLDFVYVDARHDYEGALEDMVAWWPKLRVGGLIAGHDFIPDQIKEKEGDFGVQRAVLEFTKKKGREVQSISTKDGHGGRSEPQSVDGGWTTFYFFK